MSASRLLKGVAAIRSKIEVTGKKELGFSGNPETARKRMGIVLSKKSPGASVSGKKP